MDKKLNRTIGYKPNKSVTVSKSESPKKEPSVSETPKENSSEPINVLAIIEAEKAKAKKIVQWINDHKEFKWGGMCTKLKIDRGNFQRVLKSDEPSIKVENIILIEEFLTEYGYD